jgi:hypothetical protein
MGLNNSEIISEPQAGTQANHTNIVFSLSHLPIKINPTTNKPSHNPVLTFFLHKTKNHGFRQIIPALRGSKYIQYKGTKKQRDKGFSLFLSPFVPLY